MNETFPTKQINYCGHHKFLLQLLKLIGYLVGALNKCLLIIMNSCSSIHSFPEKSLHLTAQKIVFNEKTRLKVLS